MVRNRLTARWVFTMLLAAAHPAAAQEAYLPPSISDTLQQIIDHTVLQRYAEASRLAEALEHSHPENPAGYFLHAAALQAEMMDYEDFTRLDTFYDLANRVEEICERDIKRVKNSAWPYFFIGATYGYEAVYYGRQKEYARAFKRGWQSMKYLATAQSLDPQNADIFLATGMFKYYKSKYSKLIQFLPFVEDEREEGIELIKQAIRRGKFSYAAALNTLIWIYIGEEKYDEAAKLVNEALQAYPGSRFFYWGQAAVAYKEEKWQEAAEAFTKIISSYEAEGRASPFNELVCRAVLAEIAFKQKNYADAHRLALEALDIKIDSHNTNRAKKFVDQAKRIARDTESLHASGEE